MTEQPDLSKSARRPRAASDSGVHPAEAGPEAPKPKAPLADDLPVKEAKEPQVPLSTYVGKSTRDLIDEVNKERGFAIREVVELAIKNYWGRGK